MRRTYSSRAEDMQLSPTSRDSAEASSLLSTQHGSIAGEEQRCKLSPALKRCGVLAAVAALLTVGGVAVTAGRGSASLASTTRRAAHYLPTDRAERVAAIDGAFSRAPPRRAAVRGPPLPKEWTMWHPIGSPSCRCSASSWSATRGCSSGKPGAEAPFCRTANKNPTGCTNVALFWGDDGASYVRCALRVLTRRVASKSGALAIGAHHFDAAAHPRWATPPAVATVLRSPPVLPCACVRDASPRIRVATGWTPGERIHRDGCAYLWSVPQDPSPKCATSDACPYASFGDQYDAPVGLFNSAIGQTTTRAWLHCATPLFTWPEPPAYARLVMLVASGSLDGDYARSAKWRAARYAGSTPVRHLPAFAPPAARAHIKLGIPRIARHYMYQTDCLPDGLATNLFTVGLTAWQLAWRLHLKLVWNQQHFVSENTPQFRDGFDVLNRFDAGAGDTFHGLGWGAFPPSVRLSAAQLFQKIEAKEVVPLYIAKELIGDRVFALKEELAKSVVERAVILQRCADMGGMETAVSENVFLGDEPPSRWLRNAFQAARRVLRPTHPLWDIAASRSGSPSAWAPHFVVALVMRAGDVQAGTASGSVWGRGGAVTEDGLTQFEVPQASDRGVYTAAMAQIIYSGVEGFGCASARAVVVSQGVAASFAPLDATLKAMCPDMNDAGHGLELELAPMSDADAASSARGLWRSLDLISTSDVIVMMNAGSSFGKFALMLSDPAAIKVVPNSKHEVAVLDNDLCGVVVARPDGSFLDYDAFAVAWAKRMDNIYCKTRKLRWDPPAKKVDLSTPRAAALIQRVEKELRSGPKALAPLARSLQRSLRDVNETLTALHKLGWVEGSICCGPISLGLGQRAALPRPLALPVGDSTIAEFKVKMHALAKNSVKAVHAAAIGGGGGRGGKALTLSEARRNTIIAQLATGKGDAADATVPQLQALDDAALLRKFVAASKRTS